MEKRGLKEITEKFVTGDQNVISFSKVMEDRSNVVDLMPNKRRGSSERLSRRHFFA